MDKKTGVKSNTSTPVAETSEPVLEAPVKPVRSAKDAINAMYASQSENRLSDYLAASAKEIINANRTTTENEKSAASIHGSRTKRRIETSRPSASGVLKVAETEESVKISNVDGGMDPLARKTAPIVQPPVKNYKERPVAPPVIKTSLKLGPKKVPVTSRPHTLNTKPHTNNSINGIKGKTALTQMLNRHRAGKVVDDVIATPTKPQQLDEAKTAETLRIMQQAVQKTVKPKTATSHAQGRPSTGMMQDVVRQPKNMDGFYRPAQQMGPDGLPLDSVKRRFKAAPKGYTTQPEVQESSYNDFVDAEPPRTPVEIYGMMDDEPKHKRPEMPVIEDYHPKDRSPLASSDKADAADKYRIQGQSSRFLKLVNVEKRPLSSSRKSASDGTLYERPSNIPVGGKNIYDKKETKRTLPTKPTVIIPASRKSRAPMVFLLILTVVLGAAVGAFVYLCFFQYME